MKIKIAVYVEVSNTTEDEMMSQVSFIYDELEHLFQVNNETVSKIRRVEIEETPVFHSLWETEEKGPLQ